MSGKLKEIRLYELTEGFSRAAFAREANVNDKVIKKVEEEDYSPQEYIKARILEAINKFRKREKPYTMEEVFDP